jgi:hypothetical protein
VRFEGGGVAWGAVVIVLEVVERGAKDNSSKTAAAAAAGRRLQTKSILVSTFCCGVEVEGEGQRAKGRGQRCQNVIINLANIQMRTWWRVGRIGESS